MSKETTVKTGDHKRIYICIGLPSFATVPIEFHVASQRLQMPVNARVESIVTIGEEIGDARNYIANSCMSFNPPPEHLFFIGTDMIPSWDALLILWQEMKKGKWDVLGGLYFLKNDPPTPILWREEIPGYLEEGVHYKAGEVVSSDICGMDFTLIKTDIFKKLALPYFQTGPEMTDRGLWVYTEDAYFCRKVKEAGGRIGVHTGCRVGHLDTNTGMIY